jgi:hypothetical protein
VYIYGGTSSDLPSNVGRIKEQLTRDHEFFDEENEHNCQVIIITSYPTLSSRYGPAANKRFIINKRGYTTQQADGLKFQLLRDKKNPDWRPEHSLNSLFDQVFLDEAQNSKGMLTHHLTYSRRCSETENGQARI